MNEMHNGKKQKEDKTKRKRASATIAMLQCRPTHQKICSGPHWTSQPHWRDSPSRRGMQKPRLECRTDCRSPRRIRGRWAKREKPKTERRGIRSPQGGVCLEGKRPRPPPAPRRSSRKKYCPGLWKRERGHGTMNKKRRKKIEKRRQTERKKDKFVCSNYRQLYGKTT